MRSAVRIGAIAAIKSGLYAAQRDDYPVTVKTGHSLSKLMLSPAPIDYSGGEHPDVLVVLTEDGFLKARARLAGLPAGATVYALPEFAELETAARVEVLDPSQVTERVAKGDLALMALGAVVALTGVVPVEALRDAAAEGPFGESNVEAVELGFRLAGGR